MATSQVTDGTFQSDVIDSGKLTLVDFWAEWCGPCKALGPKLEELSDELGEKVNIVKINVDENRDTPQKYGVRGIPTMILFKNGEVVDQIVGNHPKEAIAELIQNNA
ncbi:MAG: thioredoxin [Bdellovibrionaceae bacterium]|nr:thioredoxin [Pseudobdellovibrionaceae bacterium]|tara:strand:+ start:4206 stop:4526 length:321 start_codon:yes stop_codon:yes gene_type:complete